MIIENDILQPVQTVPESFTEEYQKILKVSTVFQKNTLLKKEYLNIFMHFNWTICLIHIFDSVLYCACYLLPSLVPDINFN